jgi:hypothetical protein
LEQRRCVANEISYTTAPQRDGVQMFFAFAKLSVVLAKATIFPLDNLTSCQSADQSFRKQKNFRFQNPGIKNPGINYQAGYCYFVKPLRFGNRQSINRRF